MSRKPVKHKKKVPGREPTQRPWYICKSQAHTDQNLYDAPPSEDYEEGYGTTAIIGDDPVIMKTFLLSVAFSNPYAIVIYKPDYNPVIDKPFLYVYIIHKTVWERDIWVMELEKERELSYISAHRLDACGQEKVWFHKNWKLGSYNPDKFATLDNRKYWEKNIKMPKETRIARRKILMTEQGCFTFNPDNPDVCTREIIATTFCQTCPLYEKYEKVRKKNTARVNKKRRARNRAYKRNHPELYTNGVRKYTM